MKKGTWWGFISIFVWGIILSRKIGFLWGQHEHWTQDAKTLVTQIWLFEQTQTKNGIQVLPTQNIRFDVVFYCLAVRKQVKHWLL